MRLLLIPGTHSAYTSKDREEWWWSAGEEVSPFVRKVVMGLGFTPRVFRWETRINGGPRLPWHWFRKRRHTTWESWGDALAEDLREVPFTERMIVAHSHGGAVACRAVAQVPVKLLITISSPVRNDLTDWYRETARHADRWVHVHSDADRMFRWGSYFDGKFDLFTKDKSQPFAHQNIYIPKVGHSGLLRDPRDFHHWHDAGLAAILTGCLPSGPKDEEEIDL